MRSRNAASGHGSVSEMYFKLITFFLIGMMVLAFFGKLRFPGQKKLAQMKCPKCGRYRIGKGPCPCEKKG